jgi:hypothetical protein
MTRTIVVGADFPMKLGDILRLRGPEEVLDYLVTARLDEKGREWAARVNRRERGTNKEPIMGRGAHRVQRLRSEHFPTREEMYKRMEPDHD